MSKYRITDLPSTRPSRPWKTLRIKPKLLLLSVLAFATVATGASVSSVRWLADVKYLASDQMKGRGDGSPELDLAADYIAEQFRKAGLEPLASGYFQPFEAVVGADLGTENSLVLLGTPDRSYRLNQDFVPLTFSDSGNQTGPLAFAGYGITAPEYQYDDYAGIDVRGKAVIVLRHEPQEDDANSPFRGKELTRHAALVSKAINARNHGAVAMLLVNDPLNHSADRLVSFGEIQGPTDLGLQVLHVKRDVVEKWMSQENRSLRDLQRAIDRDLGNHSFLLSPTLQVRMETDVRHRQAKLKNVVGYLPGSDPALRGQVIVLGAHYDHLGLGERDSLAPGQVGQIHHGADDNASGTAGLMELARAFGEQQPFRRSLLFIAFAGEELGLLGSAHYAEDPLLPLDRTIAMLNMDMIGRVSKNKLFVGGVGTSPGFRALLQEENSGTGFQLDFSDSGYGASDHMSFNRKQIPVMFFFSGLHADYHKPSDTWEKVRPEETARVLELVARVVGRLDAAEERPQWVPVRDSRRASAPAADEEAGQGYGPYFGSIPDFAENSKGVKFADVQANSPAAKAGLLAGDILIQFDGKEVRNLYDFSYLLRAKKPDDEVPIVILREEKEIRAVVKLGRRE
ncbi:MAG: M28 family peptidase [Acidobacteria bacterium]|nr:M28 family peptidase [Acidobacteriota bacterium]